MPTTTTVRIFVIGLFAVVVVLFVVGSTESVAGLFVAAIVIALLGGLALDNWTTKVRVQRWLKEHGRDGDTVR